MRANSRALALLAMSAAVLIFTIACGSGSSSSTSGGQAPTFTSVPVTAALEGGQYAYTITAFDPSGGTVSYALTTAPDGAAISGNTVSWTPTHAQSRQANNFTVTATTSKGGKGTQSWQVSPSGTVSITDAIIVWGPSGPSTLTPGLSQLYPAAGAIVQNADGSYAYLYNTGFNNGVMTIPNVPAGYYWLNIGTGYYWTSASNIDFGTDQAGSIAPALPAGTAAGSETVNFTGLDASSVTYDPCNIPNTSSPASAFNMVNFASYPSGFNFSTEVMNSSTQSWSSLGTTVVNGNCTSSSGGVVYGYDLTAITGAWVFEEDATTLGTEAGYVLGPSASLSGLSLQNGAANTIGVNLQPSPQQSLELTIDASQWTPLFENVSPNTPSLYGSPFSLLAEPYVQNANATSGMSFLPLFYPYAANSTSASSLLFLTTSTSLSAPATCGSGFITTYSYNYTCPASASLCPSGSSNTNLISAPPIAADSALGNIAYGDPFPSNWQRIFRFCQQELEPMPELTWSATLETNPDFTETVNYSYSFGLYNSVTTAVPTAAVTPLLSPVQSPQVNGASLFVPATLSTRSMSISWTAPSMGTPYGYRVGLYSVAAAGLSRASAASSRAFYTAQTSITIPPDFLAAGLVYYIDITALMDAKANVETAPRRSGLPTAAANVVSAPITISSSAP